MGDHLGGRTGRAKALLSGVLWSVQRWCVAPGQADPLFKDPLGSQEHRAVYPLVGDGRCINRLSPYSLTHPDHPACW